MQNKPESGYFSKYIKSNNKMIQSIIRKSEKIHCDKSQKRVKDILVSIVKKEKENLKKMCCQGLPDDLPILRALIWKINFNYLNLHIDKWEEHINKKRAEYADIKLAFMLKMEAERKLFEDYNEFHRNNKDPTKDTSSLNTFIKYTDRKLLEEVDKDVRRTHTNLNFFFMPSQGEDLEKLTNEDIREVVEKRKSNDVKTIDDIYFRREVNKFETNGDVLCRILYIYAKLNPDINYVQGMNELIAPIYFCYSFDKECDLESDTFWSFTYLMDDLKVLYMRNKDDTKEGIFKKLELLNQILLKVDKELHSHLAKHSVEVSHFAFKWFILFFTQDFILPDILRLWDTIFCVKDRFYFLFLISLAILKLKKTKILTCDFAGIIITLQNLEDLDLDKILNECSKLRKDYDKTIKKILEKNK